MCLSTAFKSSDPNSVIMEYVSRFEVSDGKITLFDVMGDTRTVEGVIEMVDLTGGKVSIKCD